VTAKTVTKSSVSESLTDSESLHGMDEHKYIEQEPHIFWCTLV